MEFINESSFLNEWDALIDLAVEKNEMAVLYRLDEKGGELVASARTRHPAFMGRQPVKHDPERDSK